MSLQSLSQNYSDEELARVQASPVPRHVAIIMDGNRRWAKKQNLTAVTHILKGHWQGASILSTIVEAASDLGIKVLTVFAFSTENWSRSSQEIDFLLNVFDTFLKENCSKMVEKGVRFDTLGDLTPFPDTLKKEIERVREATKEGKKIDFLVALNYGGRDEIRRALTSIVTDVLAGALDKNSLSEKTISQYLDTAQIADPDLLIRTSGEMRLSNFLLWQMAYSEVFVTDVLWPDFTPRDLLIAVLDFQKRTRRLGR